jgi:hypothetical protein
MTEYGQSWLHSSGIRTHLQELDNSRHDIHDHQFEVDDNLQIVGQQDQSLACRFNDKESPILNV